MRISLESKFWFAFHSLFFHSKFSHTQFHEKVHEKVFWKKKHPGNSLLVCCYGKNRLVKFLVRNLLRFFQPFWELFAPSGYLFFSDPTHSCDPRSENKIHRSIGKKKPASSGGGFSVFEAAPGWWPWLKRMWLWAFLPLHCCWCTRPLGCGCNDWMWKNSPVFL